MLITLGIWLDDMLVNNKQKRYHTVAPNMINKGHPGVNTGS